LLTTHSLRFNIPKIRFRYVQVVHIAPRTGIVTDSVILHT